MSNGLDGLGTRAIRACTAKGLTSYEDLVRFFAKYGAGWLECGPATQIEILAWMCRKLIWNGEDRRLRNKDFTPKERRGSDRRKTVAIAKAIDEQVKKMSEEYREG